MAIPKHSFHQVRLNKLCRADIAWWLLFIIFWNGLTFPNMPEGPTVVSDASGSFGGGAYQTQSLAWFQMEWPKGWEKTNIAVKEMVPIVVSAAIWGKRWCNLTITFPCDNMAVVQTLSKGSAKDPLLSHLLRGLFWL